ncbi:alpha-2-macroglobulin [Paracoccus sp. S-4012]|uniref:alpha-2-macroglobulin family protein n=1 Tax=Paracoccus sp. S-4012 TaxID=2665648 RepID=UPI0012AF77AA|nr:alpha-2-macroglobulin family protein [Paracoccus sp. S-4012]MRX51850.1 alpha-2-macroglobulin [Paracoccus sp. S-4012]
MRGPILAALLAALALPVASQPAAEAPLPERRVILNEGWDLPGGDLAQLFNTTEAACARACLADTACVALTYNHRSRACFPKGTDAGPAVPFAGASSGPVLVTDPARAAAAAARAEAASWLTPEDRADLLAQAGGLGTAYPGTGEGADALRGYAAEAEAAGDTQGAIRWTGAAAALSDAPDDWLVLARLLAAAADADDDWTRRRAAMSAAANAWLRDPGPGSAALRLWAEQAERIGRGRDGMLALRDALAADPDPALARALAGFESRHGFRVMDTQVDADAPAPRACVLLSEPLIRGTDYRSFVALPDSVLAVEAEDSQLCVTGVTHGEELRLTLRAGLPAASGEVLSRDVPVTLYIRDRTPQARFTGRAYLLPASSDQGLTLRTVNTGTVALALYRMSDRNLVRSLRDGTFARPLADWRAETFTAEMGERVWTGEADIAPAADGGPHPVNAEIATRLDIAAAAGPLEPGVYALTATVPGLPEDRSPAATQWFMISDLGLSTYSGTDGLTVVVRGLSGAAARPGVAVELVSRGNAILGRALTDAEGIARFDAGLTRGRDAAAPALVTAASGAEDATEDMAFLSLLDPEFDLSDRGVEGRAPSPPVDIFATTDRGAYRAGETVHATILARDPAARALPGLPLTAVIFRPDGVEAARMMPQKAGDGGFVLDWRVPDTAPRGSWRIDLRLEADGAPLASLRLLVEDFRPERIDLDPELAPGPFAAVDSLPAALEARWLYGPPAADLPVEGELRLAPATEVPGWEGYRFGRHDEPADPEIVTLPPGQTDAAGRWQGEIALPPSLAAATRPVEATLILAVREGAGRPVERRETRLVMPQQPVVGIRPEFSDAVPEGGEAAFRVIALGPDLALRDVPAEWVLNRIETEYQWFALGGDWMWEPVTRRTRVDGGSLALSAEGPASLAVPVNWGEYELVVTTAAGAETAITFQAGWGAATAGTDTPDRLAVTLDRPAYRAGDTARVTIDAAAEGVATVAVLSNRVHSLTTVALTEGLNTVTLPVTNDWGTGVYVAVTAIRPLGLDPAPLRALGIAHAAVDPGNRRLTTSLIAPAETAPRQTATVRLMVAGAAPGDTVRATVAAVDQGILNLTGFTAPEPAGWYFGQRRLGVALRDLYGRLILPSGARDGAIRTGGDAMSARSLAPPPTEALMAWFSGPVTVGADGMAELSVPLPDFNGEVKLMAVAWTARGIGEAEATMLVRDPVVMTVTAPAFLAPGDTAEAQVALTHVAGPSGAVALGAEVTNGPALALDGLPPEVTLAAGERVTTGLMLAAPEGEGTTNLTLTATLPDGRQVTKDLTIPILRLDPAITRATRITLAPGASALLDPATLGAFRPGTGTATLTTGAFAQLDVGAALTRLATYPYGCTEQIAAAALPQLYVAGLVPGAPEAARPMADAIAEILTRQTSEGSFGLWRAESGDPWLDAFITDFLLRARTEGHAVPEAALTRALQNLQNHLNAAGEPQYADASQNAALAYSAYVLSREHAAAVSDLRYYVDTAADHFATPMAAAHLGAALAAYGDVARADAMFRRAQAMLARGAPEPQTGFRTDYGTPLRDTAAALALAAEAGTQAVDREAAATQLSAMIGERRAEGADLSTQEALWVVLAGHALQTGPDAGAGVALGGAPLTGPLVSLGEPTGLAPLALENRGEAPIDVTLAVTGVPVEPLAAGGTAWQITRRYFTPEGLPVDPAQVAQGTRLVALLEVTPLAEGGGRLIVTDPLPAGFEIDNPNLIGAGEIAGLDWLGGLAGTDMAEFRQDRFAAAVTWGAAEPFTLAYRLRAVIPGRFSHPAATVEDMYRPERRGWTASGHVEITR